MIAFADSHPATARFLMSEAMAGGGRALDARDQGIIEIAGAIEAAQNGSSAAAHVPDLSPRVLVGGIYRLLASRLRRREGDIGELRGEVVGWIDGYGQPLDEHRWRSLDPAASPPPSPFVEAAPLRAPPALTPGRPRLSEVEVAENHRQRILFATATIAQQKGYGAATIADITKTAGVDHRVFAALFADKQDAFMAVHELGFQRTMAVTAGAYFAGASWPERIWEAGRAFTQFFQINPTIAHVGFVEPYAVGAGAIKRVEDSLLAFTIFLQEGYEHEPRAAIPTRVALEAIAATNFEIGYQATRASGRPVLSRLLPHVTHLALAPFLGAREANEFIDRQMNAAGVPVERV